MTPREWTTMLGFLAARQATIYFAVLEKDEQGFVAEYNHITGQSPVPFKGAGYGVIDPTIDKWGTSSRVTFRACDSELFKMHMYSVAFHFNSNLKKVPGRQSRQWEICTNKIVWKLLEAGFLLGTEQDITRIQDNVPDALIDAFNDGVRLGRQTPII